MGADEEKTGIVDGIRTFLNGLLFRNQQAVAPAINHSGPSPLLAPPTAEQKKAALEKACALLLKQKEIITSGKLEFIGLAKIRSHLGKEWAGLSKIVYETAQAAINAHLEPGDLSVLYNEYTYVLIFAQADIEKSTTKASAIVEQIRQGLFALDDKKVKSIEVRPSVRQFRTNDLIDTKLPDFLAIAAGDDGGFVIPQKIISAAQYARQVETSPLPAASGELPAANKHDDTAAYSYLPLWDTGKQALTTFLCTLKNLGDHGNELDNHIGVTAQKSAFEKLLFDIKVLDAVDAELQKREEEGRRLLVACPVHYETLFLFESYEKFKQRLALLPAERQKCLTLLVMNDSSLAPIKDAYWFVAPLQQYCREVLVEIPLIEDINFKQLRDSGVSAVGVRLNNAAGRPEQETISLLNEFSVNARAAGILKTFLLNVPSLSLTTFAVCAGFDYLGGTAIHEPVKKPDHVYRFRHADLLAELLQE